MTKKVDKEKRLIANQLGAATDTQSRLREELVNAREQGKKRVQNVYDEAGFQIQKLREQLEKKEKNNSALRKSNAAWALIHSSSDLPRSDCAANNSLKALFRKIFLSRKGR